MAAEPVEPLRMEPVGWHDVCGERAWLALVKGRRSVVCGCEEPLVTEGFFATAGYGRADATSSLEKWRAKG